MAKEKIAFKPLVRPIEGEYNEEASKTEAQQVKPLEQLLAHRMQGIPVHEFHGAFSDEDYPDFDKMDFDEIERYREGLVEQISDLQEQHHAYTKAQEAKIEQAQKPKPTETSETQP